MDTELIMRSEDCVWVHHDVRRCLVAPTLLYAGAMVGQVRSGKESSHAYRRAYSSGVNWITNRLQPFDATFCTLRACLG